MRRSVASGAGLAVLALAGRATADEPEKRDLVFVTDPKFAQEDGVRSTLSAGHVLFRYRELVPDVLHVENVTADRILGVTGRVLEEALLDLPLAQVEATFIHEVFGHGARAREFGYPASYSFALPEPYSALISPGTTFSAFTETQSNSGSRDHDLAIVEAGLEANYFTAKTINQELVAADGWVPTSDLDVYLAAKTTYFSTFTSRGIAHGGGAGDDVVTYLDYLQDRTNQWRPVDRVALASRLQTAYAWNYVDPTFYYAVYSLFVNRLYAGRDYARLPLPTAGGVTFYPETRFNLTPFGAEHYIDVFLKRRGLVADVYGRAGSSGLATYVGGGVHVEGIQPRRWLALGADLDVWDQPELFTSERNVYDPPQEAGVSGALYASVKASKALGVTAKLGGKSRGYLMAQPLESGPFGYLGVTITP